VEAAAGKITDVMAAQAVVHHQTERTYLESVVLVHQGKEITAEAPIMDRALPLTAVEAAVNRQMVLTGLSIMAEMAEPA
jgi:hypothetical protein